jgi:hypothetical protein
MKRSNRILILLVVFEVCLAGLWLWLMAGLRSGDLLPSGDPAETVAVVSQTLGTVMGVLGGVLLTIWFVLRRKGG